MNARATCHISRYTHAYNHTHTQHISLQLHQSSALFSATKQKLRAYRGNLRSKTKKNYVAYLQKKLAATKERQQKLYKHFAYKYTYTYIHISVHGNFVFLLTRLGIKTQCVGIYTFATIANTHTYQEIQQHTSTYHKH